MGIIFQENPKTSTLKQIKWVSEFPNDKPYIAILPFDAPNLSTECTISIKPIGSLNETYRDFKITSINTIMEFPDSWTCTLAPIFETKDGTPKNDYSDSNYNYIDGKKTTSEEYTDNYKEGYSYIKVRSTMELNFELNRDEVYDQDLTEKFCDALVESLRTEIREGLIPAKYEALEQSLINSTWIMWTEKPKRINIEGLINLILSCISWRKRKYTYQVYIRTDVKMPHTVNTTVEQVARFIDKGNEVTKYTTMLSRMFNYYQRNIDKFWGAYKELEYLDDREVE